MELNMYVMNTYLASTSPWHSGGSFGSREQHKTHMTPCSDVAECIIVFSIHSVKPILMLLFSIVNSGTNIDKRWRSLFAYRRMTVESQLFTLKLGKKWFFILSKFILCKTCIST
jgi:hypothetical protein